MKKTVVVLEPVSKKIRNQPCKCLVLNPYTQTLKTATFYQTLDNWYAVMGTKHVEQFYLQDGEGTACLYTDDVYRGMAPFGVQFQDWTTPIIGILLFIGPPDEEGNTTSITDKAIRLLQEQFNKAKKGRILDS